MKQWCLLLLLVPMFVGCRTWNFYVPQDKETRKSQQLDFRMGRSFAGKDAICVEFNLINWSSKRIQVERDSVVLRSNGSALPLIVHTDILASETFRRGVFRYYEQPGQRVSLPQWARRLYAPTTIKLRPRKRRNMYLVCYKINEDISGPYALNLENVTVNGNTVKMKPFRLSKLKKPND
ncbi:MAG: hypothetical protein EP343_11650 [Deltaproteobacteria bacterium]|nr:MAG: hypothetical protein EP343_11650 [Deltaproteobacteria bacterium]